MPCFISKGIQSLPYIAAVLLLCKCTTLPSQRAKQPPIDVYRVGDIAPTNTKIQKGKNLPPALPQSQSPFSRKTTNASHPPKKLIPPSVASHKKIKHLSQLELQALCLTQLRSIPGNLKKRVLKKMCQRAKVIPACFSAKGAPIFYFDHIAKNPKKGKRILTLSLIHGDEAASGTVAKSWIHRLLDLEPRNSWRVIPLANPDGFKLRTRTNQNGVDINRNFPTHGWSQSALKRWSKVKKKDPRRYPGPQAASESETNCLMSHFADFQPDFIVSIHTPLGVLDFDGPKVNSPPFSPLPWTSLGHFPGSLGRYMWRDNKIPVLTIELKSSYGVTRLEKFDRLQDISGTVAIQSTKLFKRRPTNMNKNLKNNKPAAKKKLDIKHDS